MAFDGTTCQEEVNTLFKNLILQLTVKEPKLINWLMVVKGSIHRKPAVRIAGRTRDYSTGRG